MTAPQDDPEQIAPRLKAARYLAGYKSTAALAKDVDERGLRTSTLNSMEQARRTSIPYRDLRTIAAVCKLPAEWFWVPDVGRAVQLGAEMLGVSAETRLDAALEEFLAGPSPQRDQADDQDERGPHAADAGG